MLLFLSQSIANSDSFSSVWRRLFKFFQVTAMVLSSAKLSISDLVSHENKTLPSIERCGTPESIVLKKDIYC